MLEIVEIHSIFSGSARIIPRQRSRSTLLPEKASSKELSNHFHFSPFPFYLSTFLLTVDRMMPLKAIQLGLL